MLTLNTTVLHMYYYRKLDNSPLSNGTLIPIHIQLQKNIY